MSRERRPDPPPLETNDVAIIAGGTVLWAVACIGLLIARLAGVAIARATFRALRPGGRVLVMGAVPRPGLFGLLARAPSGPRTDPSPLLAAEGFNTPRVLAEREGLIFVEAVKPR